MINEILSYLVIIVEFLSAPNYPTLLHYMILGWMVFGIGMCGIIISRQNIINLLMSIELILLGVSINMIAISVFTDNISGQIFSIFILTVAASEAAVGLAILVTYFRQRSSIAVDKLRDMQG